MKYAYGVIGLLVGTALGGSVVAATGKTGSANMDTDAIKQIVRDVIKNEPQVMVDSLRAYQEDMQQSANSEASKALKDDGVRNAVLNDEDLPYAGNGNGDHVIAEFFDYDCPVCKMQFKVFQEMLKKDPELKIVFHEFPIFGPTSEENSHLGLAVSKLYPEKYYEFHSKMMEGKGHETDTKRTYAIMKELGFDIAKVEKMSKSDEVQKQLLKSRELGEKLRIQGTPAVIIGDELIPHLVQGPELEAKLSAQ